MLVARHWHGIAWGCLPQFQAVSAVPCSAAVGSLDLRPQAGLCQLHTGHLYEEDRGGSQDEQAADGDEAPATETGSSNSSTNHSDRLPHITVDDPELNIYLRYNKSFKTDEQRMYKIGMLAAVHKQRDTELRKMLAAHRLELKDAQLAAGRGPPPLQDLMGLRLGELEQLVRRPRR